MYTPPPASLEAGFMNISGTRFRGTFNVEAIRASGTANVFMAAPADPTLDGVASTSAPFLVVEDSAEVTINGGTWTELGFQLGTPNDGEGAAFIVSDNGRLELNAVIFRFNYVEIG